MSYFIILKHGKDIFVKEEYLQDVGGFNKNVCDVQATIYNISCGQKIYDVS